MILRFIAVFFWSWYVPTPHCVHLLLYDSVKLEVCRVEHLYSGNLPYRANVVRNSAVSHQNRGQEEAVGVGIDL